MPKADVHVYVYTHSLVVLEASTDPLVRWLGHSMLGSTLTDGVDGLECCTSVFFCI